jgi:hypothetical protein
MTIEEAFRLVENLDYPEGLKRKFAPGYSLLQIDKDGEIVVVERYKSRPTEADQIELLNRFPLTVQINGKPGLYSSSEELKQHVIDSMWLFDKMKPASN